MDVRPSRFPQRDVALGKCAKRIFRATLVRRINPMGLPKPDRAGGGGTGCKLRTCIPVRASREKRTTVFRQKCTAHICEARFDARVQCRRTVVNRNGRRAQLPCALP